MSDEQIKKILPKNPDGSINVKFTPHDVMDNNLRYIGDGGIGYVETSNHSGGLVVATCAGSITCD